jgi:hypothetical protein
LVNGLRNERPEIRQVSLQTIQDMIVSWQSLPPDVSAPKAAQLAQVLAETLVPADADSLSRSADLAERLLDWPPSDTGGLNRVYYCERILRAAKENGWPRTDRSAEVPEPPAIAALICRWGYRPSHPAPALYLPSLPLSRPPRRFRSRLLNRRHVRIGRAWSWRK